MIFEEQIEVGINERFGLLEGNLVSILQFTIEEN